MTSKVCQFLSESGGNNFTETAPRPPVPGEENELQSNGGMSTRSSGSHKSHASSGSNRAGDVMTPRKSSKDKDKSINISCLDDDEMAAPLGFEPEGSVSNSPPFTENGTPPYMKWAESLNYLLEDRDGVQLYNVFLEQEGMGSYSVDFWFACEGLKKRPSDDGKTVSVIRAIHKKFINSDKLPCICENTKRVIHEKIKKKVDLEQGIFDDAQNEVENDMRNNTYPLFIKSDLYVQYVQKGGESPKSSNTSSGSNSARPMSSGPLPTLPEDGELQLEDTSLNSMNNSYCGPPLSKSLNVSRTSNEISGAKRTSAEAFTSFPLPYVPRTPVPHPYHVSYVTVSAQDSEIQSLSSDALTDDTRSLTDSSIDNDLKARKRHRKGIRRLAEQNRGSGMQHQFIPRTERAPKDRNIAETDPKRFAALLTEKLQRVLESRVKEERLQEVLNESSIIEVSEPEKSFNSSSIGRNNTATTSMLPLMTSTVIVDEELNPDSILEEHFARIWESSNQQTPSRSPGRHSPPNVKQKSPDRSFNRKNLSQTQPLSVPNTLPSSAIHNKSYKKRADYYSSFDSGMCEDKPVETHRHIHHHHHHHHRDNKSKNVCDLDSSQSNGLSNWGGDIYGNKDYEHGRTTRRSGNRKHSDASSNLDSGISMVESIAPIPNIHDPSTEKVLNWMMDNQRETERGSGAGGHTDSERSSSHKRLRSTDVPHKQSSSKKTTAHGMNRSQSSERPAVMQSWMASTQGQVMPNQPFAQDPSMPLPTPPNTTVQLEEAKRRLEESRPVPVKSKSFAGVTSKDKRVPNTSLSSSQIRSNIPSTRTLPCDLDLSGDFNNSQNSDKKCKKSSSSSANTSASAANTSSSSSADETIIGYFFCGEPIPYRLTVPGRNVTLATFKHLIGRRGSFKYFFKKKSNEFESDVVFEEIQDDNAVLPLWDGKVVAKVERND